MSQVVSNFIESLLGLITIEVRFQISSVNDGIYRFAGRFQISTARNLTNAFESKRVPYPCGSSIGLVDQVEDRVRVALLRVRQIPARGTLSTREQNLLIEVPSRDSTGP